MHANKHMHGVTLPLVSSETKRISQQV